MNHFPSIALITLMFASVVAAAEPESPPLTELIEKATHGDADAQLSLAMRYRDGKGMAKDDSEAMKWAHLAADKGHAGAQDFVGIAYLRGSVVTGSPEIAMGYFKAAAEK